MAVNTPSPIPSNDIELYRKKRRRKRKLRRLGTVAVVLVIAGIMTLLATNYGFGSIYDLLRGNVPKNSGESAGFPKKLFGDRPLQFGRCGSSLVMATDGKLYFYSGKGETLLNLPHSYTRPSIYCTDNRVLLYDRGGNHLQVDTDKGTSFEREMANEIICGAMNNRGSVAVATTEERYAGSVTVYSAQNKQLFKWYSSDGQITGAALRDDGWLAVSCIGAKDGAILSTVYLMNISQGEEQQVVSVPFTDLMILSARFKSNGSLCVIGDTKISFLSTGGEIQAEYPYSKNISDFADLSGSQTAIALSSSANSEEREIVLLDNGGSQIGSYTVKQEIKWIEAVDGAVYVLGENEILHLDSHMNLVEQIPVRSDTTKIAVIGSAVYALGLGEISVAGMQ